MIQPRIVHLIDADERRRAAIAHDLYSKGIHVEIYEGNWEFSQRVPTSGAVLAGDYPERAPNELFELIESTVGYLPVAMFASSPSPEMIVRAMRCGAISYLAWPLEPAQIDRVMTDLARHGEHEAAVAKRMASAKEAVSSLSKREFEVLQELIDGASSKQIARNLDVSPRTIDIHRANVMTKLNVHTVADVVRIGIYAGVDEMGLLETAAGRRFSKLSNKSNRSSS